MSPTYQSGSAADDEEGKEAERMIWNDKGLEEREGSSSIRRMSHNREDVTARMIGTGMAVFGMFGEGTNI